jgi:hypothetical protein
MWRSKKVLVTFLTAPLLLVALMWLIQARINANNNKEHGGVDVPIQYKPCHTMDVYGHVSDEPCVSVYYSRDATSEPRSDAIMQRFSARLGLQFRADVVGVDTVVDLIETMVAQVGRFDAAISFGQLPAWCPEMPCDDVTQEEKDAANAAEAQRAQARREAIAADASSCPLDVSSLTAVYSLWVNTTRNSNDGVPGFVVQPQPLQDDYMSVPVPPRYWAMQQAMNLAITDVMTGVTGEGDSTADPAVSNLHVSLFSMYKGRTGSSTWGTAGSGSGGNTWKMDAYGNDAVPKFVGSVIMTISVMVRQQPHGGLHSTSPILPPH